MEEKDKDRKEKSHDTVKCNGTRCDLFCPNYTIRVHRSQHASTHISEAHAKLYCKIP